MFQPNFQITNKLLDSISKASAIREVIINAPILPAKEASLKYAVVLANAHASTSIEGNTLTIDDVNKLAEGGEVLKTRKEKQEVLNYLSALDDLENWSPNGILDTKHLLRCHQQITKDVLDNKNWEGQLRHHKVIVGNQKTGEIAFIPPQWEEVPQMIEQFLFWLNAKKDIHPIIESGITHYQLAKIHPFYDGNGRVARFAAYWTLVKRKFDERRVLNPDEYYNKDRKNYYEALKTVDPQTQDMTRWLEYFAQGIAVSAQEVKQKVWELSDGARGKYQTARRQTELTPRQSKIVAYINQHDSIANSQTQKLLGVSRQMATKELANLVDTKLIKKLGSFKDARYKLLHF